VTAGAFRGRWWNHFERGVSYADGRLWKQAEEDFQQALRQRATDQRRARTYGMHFIDYFPHRELGVVLFHQGRYEEAIRELEASLGTEKSAKAEFYRDSARQALIKQQQSDVAPPHLDVGSPLPDVLTNAFAVVVSGVARDDTFVKAVRVNGISVRVDTAAPEVHFAVEVPLKPGKNIIRIAAADLSDKQTVVERTLQVDREGPVLSIDEPMAGAAPHGAGVRLRGTAYDDSGLSDILVNGHPILKAPAREVHFDYRVPAAPVLDKLVILARDRAGNRTSAEIDLTPQAAAASAVLVASLDPFRVALFDKVTSAPDLTPPSIEIKGCTADQTTFLDQVYLEGVARDDGGIGFLAVNGRTVVRTPGKHIYFSFLAQLDPGENCFVTEARDLAGNRTEHKVCFHREVQKVHDVGSRLRVALLPLEHRGVPGGAAAALEEVLLAELAGGRRFHLVERRRLEEILREQRLGASELADQHAAIRIGKILAAHCVFMGTVLEREGSLEIFLHVVDTETSLILTAVDVYGEDVSPETLRLLCRGLVIKLLDELPLVEGVMIAVRGSQGVVDLGRDKRVKKGMRVIIFEEGEPVRHPLTGMVLGADVEQMGLGMIQLVHDQVSDVELLGGEAPGRVKPLQKVITQ
jgi:hypothetical protein